MSSSSPPEPLSVHELQALVQAATHPAPLRRNVRSRSAELHLIDLLSRWGGSGLAVFAAAAVFIAIVFARDHPLRAAVWTALLFAALYVCRRSRKEFRGGDKIASRPFRWRANYTSAMSVVSAAFGAGAAILAVPATTTSMRFEIIIAFILAILVASAFQTAHRLTAVAALLPGGLFITMSMLRGDGFSLPTLSVAAILAAGLAAIAFGSSHVARAAYRKHPRTCVVRREFERGNLPAQETATPAKAAQA